MWCEHGKASILIISSFKDFLLNDDGGNGEKIKNPRWPLQQINWYSDTIPEHLEFFYSSGWSILSL
jgi:hypothetical protein